MISALPQTLIILFAVAGFFISWYIGHKKKKDETVVCPLHADCETVIHSQFAKFFGVPVELMGMIYYGLIALAYGAFILFPNPPAIVEFALFVATTTAFLFSIYLTFLQAFTIKQWCSWCLTSASLCTIIFGLAVSGVSGGILEFLAANRSIIISTHVLGFVIGLGGATISDILFFRFLRDFKITEKESEVVHLMSQIIWFGLAVVIVAGLGLYLPETETYNESSKFLSKMFVVLVITVNGAFLNLYVSPRLVSMSFEENVLEPNKAMSRYRNIAFGLGGISFVSWYSAFILGLFSSIPLSVAEILGIYVILIVIAIVVSQVVENSLVKKAN